MAQMEEGYSIFLDSLPTEMESGIPGSWDFADDSTQAVAASFS
jgi:hypothetical protein